MSKQTRYVDGFLIPIKKDNLEIYTNVANIACSVWKEHGAIDYVETVGDDLDTSNIMMRSFNETAQAGPDDLVIFAWITYPSKQVRDEVNKKVMEDPRIKSMPYDMESVFDHKKMSYGGFRTIVTME